MSITMLVADGQRKIGMYDTNDTEILYTPPVKQKVT